MIICHSACNDYQACMRSIVHGWKLLYRPYNPRHLVKDPRVFKTVHLLTHCMVEVWIQGPLNCLMKSGGSCQKSKSTNPTSTGGAGFVG